MDVKMVEIHLFRLCDTYFKSGQPYMESEMNQESSIC